MWRKLLKNLIFQKEISTAHFPEVQPWDLELDFIGILSVIKRCLDVNFAIVIVEILPKSKGFALQFSLVFVSCYSY
jgi:hypothetical protein